MLRVHAHWPFSRVCTIPNLSLQPSFCATSRTFLLLVIPFTILSLQLRGADEQPWHPLEQCEPVEGWSVDLVGGWWVGLCWRPITINGLLPPMRRGHEVTIHHSHVHVPSHSFFLLLWDHTGRSGIETRAIHWYSWQVFPFISFLHSSSLLCLSPILLSVAFPEPIPFLCCLLLLQLHTTWTLGALSSNPAPVLSQHRNNSDRASTAQNQSLQKNSSSPSRLWDPQHPTASARQPVSAWH